MVYLTSDLHLTHKNIIKYTNRPFENIESFEEYYINMHNSMTNEDDIIIFIGDMMWGRGMKSDHLKSFLSKIKGRKWLIKGNHDTYENSVYYECGFEVVKDYLILGNNLIIHYQLTKSEYSTEKELEYIPLIKKHKIKTIYHGHIHNRDSTIKEGINRINCCIDYYKNNYQLIKTNLDIL